MAEFSASRIEPMSDPSSDRQEQPAPKQHAKPAPAGKATPPAVPKVSEPDEEDKHSLDEMA
jgi:hypothetical protein